MREHSVNQAMPTLVLVTDDGDPQELSSDWRLWLLDMGFRTFELTYSCVRRDILARLNPTIVVLVDARPTRAASLCRAIRSLTDAYIMVIDRSLSPDGPDLLRTSGVDHYSPTFPKGSWVPRWLAGLAEQRGFPLDRDEVVRFGPLSIDHDGRQAALAGKPLHLTKIEFNLLALLTSDPGRVFTRAEVLEAIWDGTWHGDGAMLDVHIANLRKKLGESGRRQRLIRTVRGVGFRFVQLPVVGEDAAAPGA